MLVAVTRHRVLMYTAVRIVKMYACRKPTSTSNAVTPTSMRNGMMPSGMKKTWFVSASTSDLVRMAKVTRRMWPASMLAMSRTVSENGVTMIVETNSMAPTRGFRRWDPGGPQQVAEVAGALVLQADTDEGDPHRERQHHRHGDTGRGRHLEERDDARHVAEVDEDEEA